MIYFSNKTYLTRTYTNSNTVYLLTSSIQSLSSMFKETVALIPIHKLVHVVLPFLHPFRDCFFSTVK